MAATDAFYRNQKTLNAVFAATSVLMLVTVVWMFADDFNRGYKKDQRVFRTVEEEMNKRAVLALAPDAGKEKEIVASEAEVVRARQLVDRLKPLVNAEVAQLLPKKTATETRLQNTKADYDSAISYFNIAVEQSEAGKDSPDAKKYLAVADKLQPQMDALRGELEALNELIERAADTQFAVEGGSISLNEAQRRLKDVEARHKKLTGDFDRFLKLAAQKQWGLGDTVRALPVIDGFASPVKIKQTFHDDLPIDYGGFKYVTRYDRCTTCHLGIDKASYDRASLARLVNDPNADPELMAKCEDAQRALQERQKQNPDGNQDVNQLSARALQPKAVRLSEGQVNMFAAHPRLDLFVDANSPHPIEKFGCTSCHSGQGSATGFVDATHSPNTPEEREKWIKQHNWQNIHFWDFPMLPTRFVEASCLKCHHQVEGLIRDGNKVEAPKLVKGYNLVRELGCFGCHEITGTKAGRAVGPDMRLEPDPPLESLPAAERAKRLADTANPPGTFRKVGPSLYRIAEKTFDEWMVKWLKAPRAFRPDTRMPHFYLQANNVPESLAGTGQEKFPDAEVRSISHYLLTKSRTNLETIAGAAKRSAAEQQADAKLVEELTAKLAKADDLSEGDKRDAGRRLREAMTRMAAAGQPLPVDQSITLPAAPADDTGKAAQRDTGRHLFATKGCVACHRHEAAETAGQFADGRPLPAIIGESNFGPDLSRLASKLGSAGNPEAGRKWLVQWLMDPKVHSPRTLMPVTHLTINEANDIASWLLAQQAKPDAEWDALTVGPADRETLTAMTRNYLRKAGLTTREIEAVLKDGFTKDQLAYRADDADEQELAAPLDDGKLMNYVGKKAIGNLGCFGCHNIPGFDNAKPIGVNLQDWGVKDPDRIAYEDAENYVAHHYNLVPRRTDPTDPSKPADDYKPKAGDARPLERFAPYDALQAAPYEQFFYEMLHHGHRKREGFLHLKLMSPRSYDYNRIREWNDRTRMPQFKFARTVRAEGESDEAFLRRSDFEEAEAREAVMTFVLGLIAEPVPPKFLDQPSGDRLAQIKGRRVIEQFNCASCHLIRPGFFELVLNDDPVKDEKGNVVMVELKDKDGNVVNASDGKPKMVPLTNRRAVTERLAFAHLGYTNDETGDPKEHPYPGHAAWTAPPQTSPDRLAVRGVTNYSIIDPDGNTGMTVRPAHAVTFTDLDETLKTIPASPTVGIPMTTPGVREIAPEFGGSFALRMKEYLSNFDRAVYGDPVPLHKLDDGGQAQNGYAALPPSLFFQGERVQTDWLFRFLLEPYKVRKVPLMMMPKFSLSQDDAQSLVAYFAAVNRLNNPAIGLTYPYAQVPQRDEKYLLERTREYVERLKANNLFDQRVKELTPLWAQVAREQQAAAERRAAEFKAVNDQPKAEAALKEAESLKSQLGANNFPAQQKQWEEREAYVADAWKLVTYPGNLCLTCHQVGPALPTEYRAPNLHEAWQRLRPEWTERWIAYPQRLTPYSALMQPQFKPAEAKKHAEENKVFVGTPDEQIRASRDLLMMFPMIQDWPVIKNRVGPNAFGPAAPPAGANK